MHESKELVEFAQNLESEIVGQLHENQMNEEYTSFREQIFTDLICENMVEFGVTEDVQSCFMDKKYNRGIMKVNAWCVNQDAGKVVLVVSLYQTEQLKTVHRKDLELAIQRAVRVFEAASAEYHEEMEPASDAFSMVQRLAEVAESTLDLNVLILTNGIAAGQIEDVSLPVCGPSIRWDIWDLVRLERCMASGKSYEAINIDLTRMRTGALHCLKMSSTEADYDAYMTIIPGDLLYQLYDEYGSKLLELNVRSFLQARGKVNKGIRDTIRHEPERFLAYNNGISATAEKIEVECNADGQLDIVSMEGFQVVNGAQTMASIHRARKVDQTDLDAVYVQAKITVIDSKLVMDLVPKVSRYSNTQNKVNEADFSANDPFHIEIERLSEKIWCPGEQIRWFYERARGQYQVARMKKGTTTARRKQFDGTTPRAQKFDKPFLAKYMNAWDKLPHIVSRGSQKNFVNFMTSLQCHSQDWCPDEHYYRNLISMAIIFKKAEKIARQHKFPAYRANAVAYTVSLLSHKTIGRIDLQSIWQNQSVSDALADTMYTWMPEIVKEIEVSADGRNITEWCKKEECWRTIQTMDVEVPRELQNELAEGQALPTVGSNSGQRGEGLSHLDRENIAKTMQLSGEEWLAIHKWATESGMHSVMSGIALSLSGYAANDWMKVPSSKQSKQAVKLIQQHKEYIEAPEI
jgi:hypothetical protein